MSRILGIDYGLKRVGLAVTDDLRIISSPLDVLINDGYLLEKLKGLCEEYDVGLIVLGLPLSDKYKEAENMVREFAARLSKTVTVPIEFQDETLSTKKAGYRLDYTGISSKKKKKNLDKYAAQGILEDYLRKRGS